MGVEIAGAIISSLFTGISAKSAGKRAKKAQEKTETAERELEEKQDVSRRQTAQRITKGQGARGTNPARSTILTGGLDLGAPQTGKTLLGE